MSDKFYVFDEYDDRSMSGPFDLCAAKESFKEKVQVYNDLNLASMLFFCTIIEASSGVRILKDINHDD